jgi:hypothetical protein
VRTGGTLNVTSNGGTIESGGSVSGGAGGPGGTQGVPAGGGAGAGAGMFLMSGATVNFTVNGTVIVNDSVADDSASSLPGPGYTPGTGNGATINLDGNGILSLQGNDPVAFVVNAGTLGGTGTVGDITLNAGLNGGSIGPGDSPGTLKAKKLHWNGGSAANHTGIKFQLGNSASSNNSDLMQMSASLEKGSGSVYVFHFGDGTGTPTPGATYTLMTFASTTFNTNASEFSFDYSGAGAVTGSFSMANVPGGPRPTRMPLDPKAPLPPNALQFHVNNTTPVRLQSFEVD